MAKFCQSCYMPLKHDPKGGGSETGGEKSEKYCSYCYEEGKFTWPDATLKEMREFVINQMVNMKYPRFIAKLLTMNMKHLERWHS